MDEINFKRSKILVRQLLLCFIDFNRTVLPYFDKRKLYRLPFKEYDRFRVTDKEKFRKELYRLKQYGFIKKYYQGKEQFLTLTKKGESLTKRYLIEQLDFIKPKIWDKKWRLVIFDIPNPKKKSRDAVRRKLENIGFIKLQESVYVFPFECLLEINFLKNTYYLSPYIQYIVAERIESEINLIKKFLRLHVLEDKMIK